MQWLADGFILKREDRSQKDIHISLIDYAGMDIPEYVESLNSVLIVIAIIIIINSFVGCKTQKAFIVNELYTNLLNQLKKRGYDVLSLIKVEQKPW